MAVFAAPCETADATAAPTAALTAATAAGAFAAVSAKPAAATDSLRPGPGFAPFSLLRFKSLDWTDFGSLSPPAPADFRGAVAALTVAATLRGSAPLTAAAIGVTGLTPFLEGAAEITLGESAFPAAFDGAAPRLALESAA